MPYRFVNSFKTLRKIEATTFEYTETIPKREITRILIDKSLWTLFKLSTLFLPRTKLRKFESRSQERPRV